MSDLKSATTAQMYDEETNSDLMKAVFYLYVRVGVNAFVIPHPKVTTLFYGSAPLANSPECLRDWGRIVEVKFGEIFFDGTSGSLSLIVWDCRIEVVSHVG